MATIREGTQTHKLVLLMQKHKDKPMDFTCQKAVEELGFTMAKARSWYRGLVRSNSAPGKIEETTRGRKAGETKKDATDKAGAAAGKTPAEISAAKAKTLETIKKVSAKKKQEKVPA